MSQVSRTLQSVLPLKAEHHTVVVDKHYPTDEDVSDDDPSHFEGVWFDHVRYGVHKQRSLTIANTGRVPATMSFIDRPVGAGQLPGIAPTWLKIKVDEDYLTRSGSPTQASHRILEPGDTCNVVLSLRIMDPHTVKALNEGIDQLDDILVLRVENGRDHFIPVRGKWLESSLGRSINKLIRIPEGGIRRLQHQRPKSTGSRDLPVKSPEELPVKWSAPRELFRLTEATETLTEAVIAELGMIASDEKPPWSTVAGWPFVKESWSATDEDQRADEMAAISEALDTDIPLEKSFNHDISKQQRLESLAAFVMQYILHVEDGVVTQDQWEQVEQLMQKMDYEKKPASTDDQKTLIQEILSQSSAHSISFILLTSMMDRIINEIAAASSQRPDTSAVDLPTSPLKRTGTIRKKDISKEPVTALRQITSRAYASIFAEAMIWAPIPQKEKDRTALQERKTRLIELFITNNY